MAQLRECLHSMQEALVLLRSTMVVHTYDPGTQEVGGSEVQTEKKKL